jgi:hypothetical protein
MEPMEAEAATDPEPACPHPPEYQDTDADMCRACGESLWGSL